MTYKTPTRVKSAAFLRQKSNPEEIISKKAFLPSSIIGALPVSESRVTLKPCELQTYRKTSSLVKLGSSKTSTSEIWRHVHSTRSQFKLRSLSLGIEEQPVRKNLMEKVDRIKSKYVEQEQLYRRCLNAIARKSVEKSQTTINKGTRSELERRIMSLLVPFEQAKNQAQERYRARLLRVKRC